MKTTHLRRPSLLLGIILCAGLAGCSVVESRQPMGLEPAADVAEQLQGVWSHGKDVVCMTHSATGVCSLAYIESSKQVLEANIYQLAIRRSPQRIYANLTEPKDDPAATSLYCVALLQRSDNNHCTVILPRVAAFAAAVEQAALAGTNKSKDNVTIDCTPAQFEQYLAGVAQSNVWRTEEAIHLIRLVPVAGTAAK
jgi:hypothetical protein